MSIFLQNSFLINMSGLLTKWWTAHFMCVLLKWGMLGLLLYPQACSWHQMPHSCWVSPLYKYSLRGTLLGYLWAHPVFLMDLTQPTEIKDRMDLALSLNSTDAINCRKSGLRAVPNSQVWYRANSLALWRLCFLRSQWSWIDGFLCGKFVWKFNENSLSVTFHEQGVSYSKQKQHKNRTGRKTEVPWSFLCLPRWMVTYLILFISIVFLGI